MSDHVKKLLKRKLIAVYVLGLILSASVSMAQGLPEIVGLPKITHYTREDFEIETQFWSMAEDNDGIIYFGTNWGIAILTGQEWTSLKMPNGSDVRAVYHTEDNRILVGAYNEIGEIKRDEYGKFYYESLLYLISEDENDFGLIWQIEALDELLIFRSFTKLIFLSDNKATVIPTSDIFWSVDVVEGKAYVTMNDGIHLFIEDRIELELIIESLSYNYERIIAILPLNQEKATVFTRQGNSYILNLKTDNLIFDRTHVESPGLDQIFCAKRSSTGEYLLGTINNYLKIYDPKKPELVRTRNDLQDKTVLNIYESRNGNIWTLLNRGVDHIDMSFPGTTIFTNAAIYDTEFIGSRLFVATNQGTYRSGPIYANSQLSTSDFELVSGLEAQTWSVQIVGGTLFIGHDNGAYYLDEKLEPVFIDGTYGIWKVIRVPGYENKLFACGYDGLFLIEKVNGKYQATRKIANFEESARDIVAGKSRGEFWICHGIKGIYHVRLDSELNEVISREHFTDKNGLPTTHGINVSTYNEEIVFLTSFGVYTYSDSLGQFAPHPELQRIFSNDKVVTNLTQYRETVWFVHDNSMGFYSLSSPQHLNKDLFASLNGTFITSMEHLYPINSQTILVGTNTGLYQFKHISPNTTSKIPTHITSVRYKDAADNIQFETVQPSSLISLSPEISSLEFTYAAPLLSSKKDVQYRYKLENFDQSWSNWTIENSKEYSFLKPGSYIFLVEAKDNRNTKSELISYSFEILPPWYQSNQAMLLFALIFLSILGATVFWVRHRYRKSLAEQDRIRKVLELELQQVKLEREKESILKDNTLLEDDIVNQNKELANYTLQLSKNHDLLIHVKDTLNEIKKEARLEKTKTRIRELARKISVSLDEEEHLKIFDTNFEKVHQSFFNELKAKYPDLSQKELRLCGFVKMNMTNKEIASVLNISIRGVETARYRLRKHLSLDHDINFVEFLDALSSGNGSNGQSADHDE